MKDIEEKAKQRMRLEKVPDSLPPVPAVEDENVQAELRSRNWLVPLVLAIALCGVLCWWFFANNSAPKQKKMGPMPVTVATVVTRTMPVEIRTIGNVTPISTVQVKSRIEGHIMSVHFQEGQFVQKGQLLFTIDPRPLEAALGEMRANVLKMQAGVKQAEAMLSKDKALLAQAIANKARDVAQQKLLSKEFSRYSYLAKQGAVSMEQIDQVRANADASNAIINADEAAIENCRANTAADQANLQTAKAQLAAAQAQLQNAMLNVEYTKITAPIAGRTGSLQAFAGNMVKPEEATLVVINQMDPIYVTFAVPEQVLPEVHKYQQLGTLEVIAYPAGDRDGLAGKLTFSENSVDTTTGTIRLKATYPNLDGKLWPGEFVNVTLKLTDQANAFVVPQQAVQSGQKGQYVFLLKPDGIVHVQPVVADRTVGSLTVVSSGLQPGDKVVTDGQLQLNEGAAVVVKGEIQAP
jgi:multidrug efflux system membrane fusion protein